MSDDNADLGGPSWADKAHDMYMRRLQSVADNLHRLADSIEREGRPTGHGVDTFLGPSAHVQAAGRVVHDLDWGVANLSLSTLIDYALSADEAARTADPDTGSDEV